MSEREIAEDIMRAVGEALGPPDVRVPRAVYDATSLRVGLALQAERERCAKIADDFPDTTNHPAGTLYGAGFAAAVQLMRLAIGGQS